MNIVLLVTAVTAVSSPGDLVEMTTPFLMLLRTSREECCVFVENETMIGNAIAVAPS